MSKKPNRSIARSAIRSGGALTALGVGGYVASRAASPTALIPAAIGVPIVACGVAAAFPVIRRVARPAVGALALTAMAGSARGLKQLPALVTGEAERPMAVISQTITFATSAVLLTKVMRG